MLALAEKIKKYGTPNKKGTYLVIIDLPYPMRLAWDRKTIVTKMRCHKLAATAFVNVFKDLLLHYGLPKIQELGIDLFGGCFVFRPKRGTEKRYNALVKAGSIQASYEFLSDHSWGIAIDLDPDRNQLKENSKTARFARLDYRPMIDIFYKHGFINLGVERNFDWMHFEINS
jgi:hypothetical protein